MDMQNKPQTLNGKEGRDMTIKQISVFVENKPGRLAEITGIVSGAGVDIRALSIADTADFGILRLIVSDPVKAISHLKEAGLTVNLTDVLAVELDDKPGALHRVLELLSAGGVTVEYAYAFITRKDMGAYVILRVEKPDGAAALLEKGGVRLLDSAEVYAI